MKIESSKLAIVLIIFSTSLNQGLTQKTSLAVSIDRTYSSCEKHNSDLDDSLLRITKYKINEDIYHYRNNSKTGEIIVYKNGVQANSLNHSAIRADVNSRRFKVYSFVLFPELMQIGISTDEWDNGSKLIIYDLELENFIQRFKIDRPTGMVNTGALQRESKVVKRGNKYISFDHWGYQVFDSNFNFLKYNSSYEKIMGVTVTEANTFLLENQFVILASYHPGEWNSFTEVRIINLLDGDTRKHTLKNFRLGKSYANLNEDILSILLFGNEQLEFGKFKSKEDSRLKLLNIDLSKDDKILYCEVDNFKENRNLPVLKKFDWIDSENLSLNFCMKISDSDDDSSRLGVSYNIHIKDVIIQKKTSTHILSIGVSDYSSDLNSNGVQDLNLCDDDATGIHNYFLSGKTGEIGYNQKLLDNEATKENILQEIEKMAKIANEDDLIIFYFSGHGGPNYFLCYNQLLNHDDIKKLLGISKCKRILCIADACYSGTWSKSHTNLFHKSSITQLNEIFNSSLLESKEGVSLLLSSSSNETSLEAPYLGHGIFTFFVMEGIYGSADANSDGIVKLGELFDYVQSSVSQFAFREHNHSQHPQLKGNFSIDLPISVLR